MPFAINVECIIRYPFFKGQMLWGTLFVSVIFLLIASILVKSIIKRERWDWKMEKAFEEYNDMELVKMDKERESTPISEYLSEEELLAEVIGDAEG